MIDVPSRWAELVAQVNGRTTFGQAGIRDPENICTAFEPGVPDGDCETDGHYMCNECSRMKVCECGIGRPSHCELEPRCLLRLRMNQWFEQTLTTCLTVGRTDP